MLDGRKGADELGRNDVLSTVGPGTLPRAELRTAPQGRDRCGRGDRSSARNMPKVREALTDAGLTERAIYVERGTTTEERVFRLADKTDDDAPYFALILVPGEGRRP